ncbi:hypothetical protein BX600DRAFT_435995 [Xylariales sp. PMI_506]|nr:hypothetical protein BX600DRAFT_435995 [Xylariales sp. PMI_506]
MSLEPCLPLRQLGESDAPDAKFVVQPTSTPYNHLHNLGGLAASVYVEAQAIGGSGQRQRDVKQAKVPTSLPQPADLRFKRQPPVRISKQQHGNERTQMDGCGPGSTGRPAVCVAKAVLNSDASSIFVLVLHAASTGVCKDGWPRSRSRKTFRVKTTPAYFKAARRPLACAASSVVGVVVTKLKGAHTACNTSEIQDYALPGSPRIWKF